MEGDAMKPGPEGKGKGPEPNQVQEGTPGRNNTITGEGNTGGLLPRMVQSAASLPTSLLSGLPGTRVGVGNEKGESSRAGEALARMGDNSVQFRSNLPSGGGMRMGQTQEHIAQEEASFAAFLDSDATPRLSAPSDMGQAWETAAVSIAGESRASRPAAVFSQTVMEQEANDGADVVALLSSDDALEPVFESVHAPPSENDLAGLRKALFGEETDHGSSGIAWDNVLNFVPEYLQAPTAGGLQTGHDLSIHMGTADAEEGWQTWINQWSRVLTSYQDEVWGDLNALVEEARAEVKRIQEAEPGEKPPEPTALLRLRAILGHLRGG